MYVYQQLTKFQIIYLATKTINVYLIFKIIINIDKQLIGVDEEGPLFYFAA